MINLEYELKQKNMSVRKAAIRAGVPYSTLSDIVKGKSNLEDCTYRTLKKIAALLNTSVEKMMYEPEDFQLFRNNLHHKIVRESKVKVMLDILESKDIDRYWDNRDYIKALYLLSVLDLFSEEENIPKVEEYSAYRNKALEEPFYVGDFVNGNVDDCIAEFRRHNIFEGDLYDAV